ncbi:SUKH-4 family immunity protein [Streptomyces sp. NPDC026673]|uniref:SUKH-4 family immunity protein n=1 Tax=Streptomyces sp. NPDC026673 TaxID=3155724 RepID=UPI00340DF828
MTHPLIGRAEMESAFGSGELVTADEAALTGVAHRPTTAFLRDVGLPDRSGWFEADQLFVDGELVIGGEGWRAVAERYPSCPFDMSAWLSLGGIGLSDVMVDTGTGSVYCIPEDGGPHLLNSGVDALAFFLHALERERPEYDPEAATDDGVDPLGAAERLLGLMRATDPSVMENRASLWYLVLDSVRRLLNE